MIEPTQPTTVQSAVYSSDRRYRNRDLQWLRAFAASSVVLFHASERLMLVKGDASLAAVFGPEFGVMGVAIFFAISGTLMIDALKTNDAHRFLIHRIVRLYPLLILTTLALPTILNASLRVDGRALLLVPNGSQANYRLGYVEWTLVFEMFFYVVLFHVALIRSRKALELFAVGWLAWIGFFSALGWAAPQMTKLVPFIWQMPFQTTSTAFAAGMLIPSLARRKMFPPALAPVSLGLVLICLKFDVDVSRIIAGIAAVILVGIVVQARADYVERNPLARVMTKLGDWSYALYLCHLPIQIWILTNWDAAGGMVWVAAVVLPILVCVPLGMGDIRLYRHLRAKVEKLSDRQSRILAAAFVAIYVSAAAGFAIHH